MRWCHYSFNHVTCFPVGNTTINTNHCWNRSTVMYGCLTEAVSKLEDQYLFSRKTCYGLLHIILCPGMFFNNSIFKDLIGMQNFRDTPVIKCTAWDRNKQNTYEVWGQTTWSPRVLLVLAGCETERCWERKNGRIIVIFCGTSEN